MTVLVSHWPLNSPSNLSNHGQTVGEAEYTPDCDQTSREQVDQLWSRNCGHR